MITVYAAGPMRSKLPERDYDSVWREYTKVRIKNELPHEDIRVIDPTSYKTYSAASDIEIIFDKYMMGSQATLQQDMAGIAASDILLMNLLPYQKSFPLAFDGSLDNGVGIGDHPSIGTFAEFGIALLSRKPVIVVTQDNYVVNHPFIKAGALKILHTVDDGIDYTIGFIKILLGI
jgi:nucleoside 2-deoxyribosyltransferase